MSKLVKSIEDAASEVTSLELKLAATQDKLKRAEVRLEEAYHNDRRALLVKLDGSTENVALQAGVMGETPVRTFRRERLRVLELVAHSPFDPISTTQHDRETFRLLAQVGKLYIYGEV